jgi:hypothetical protein
VRHKRLAFVKRARSFSTNLRRMTGRRRKPDGGTCKSLADIKAIRARC